MLTAVAVMIRLPAGRPRLPDVGMERASSAGFFATHRWQVYCWRNVSSCRLVRAGFKEVVFQRLECRGIDFTELNANMKFILGESLRMDHSGIDTDRYGGTGPCLQGEVYLDPDIPYPARRSLVFREDIVNRGTIAAEFKSASR